MPVTITREKLAEAIRISADGATVTPPLDAILDRQLAVATAHVNAHAPSAPDASADAAVTIIVQHLFEGWPMADALASAAAILERWHQTVIRSL